ESIEASLDVLWKKQETPHLFLTMAFDDNAAQALKSAEWNGRRSAALEVPFRVCQLWMQRMIAANMMDEASVIAVTRLGGDFGFSGQRVQSFEAIGGLIKAMLIESWMRGFRTTPMKVVDASAKLTSGQIVAGVLRELAVPSYDMEIALETPTFGPTTSGSSVPVRKTVQAVPSPMPEKRPQKPNQITRGGTWIVTGGGRGITAAISQEFAVRHGLKLRLLGTAPAPQLSAAVILEAERDMAALRRRIMQQAASEGQSPIESWRRMEKAIEIHRTLADCAARGIDARYYCCDVGEFAEVSAVLSDIRRVDGTIHGVVHGAGFGQDSRFDRKRPDKVRQCLKAKIDGTVALMEATMADQLEWFVAFGSISGRFGANGHTDYSLANDMMAKIVDGYRAARPTTRSVTFHWHAWGDIGMATKPEARLALEMIDMRFMPAAEGMDHFLNELEYGGDESEVLITDEEYFRKFFPADRLSSSDSRPVGYPLVSLKAAEKSRTRCVTQVTLNPVTDAFLTQHRVGGRPVLPFVVAIEMMAETASVLTNVAMKNCLSATARQAIRFATDDPIAVVLEASLQENGQVVARLLADVRRRDGRLVEEGREYFRAVFASPSSDTHAIPKSTASGVRDASRASWEKVRYAEPDAHVWHGPVFQELRKYKLGEQQIVGRIAASAAVQLFGGERATGFLSPSSTFDACLYLIGLANVRMYRKLSLPVEFLGVQFGRLPDPGEPCDVRTTLVRVDDRGATWSFELTGQNGDVLLQVGSCRTGWLSEPAVT
ncbi:MAG: SDR family NAD(P)-dependent oxidoreductase, partial [Planctomycetaceae bacterium]|nr:SDR family NAD(P)-dependent oxidoreductase [Planctomycetaceae bacterium]